MGSNKFDDSGVMDLTKNIMIMLFIGLFMIIIFVVLVYFYSKSRVPQAMEDNNRVYEQQGLDTSFLKTIRVIQFDPKDFNEGIECAVCLSDLKEGETARILPKCDHGFHVECIDMWFHSHSTCPVCRNPIIDQTDIKLEQEESTNVLLVEDEANNDHQASSSEQASSSSSLLTYKNRERPHLVIDIPPREVIVEEDEKTPVSSSRMRSLKIILSNSASFNPFSPGSQSATNSELHIQPVKS